MPEQPSYSEEMGKLGANVKDSLVKAMVEVHGNRPSDAKPLSHDEELRLWMLPTSPAAVNAFKMGGTLDEANQANQMWYEGMKAQQKVMAQQGATPEQIHEAGFSDDKIAQVTRAHAYARGQANGGDDPEKVAAYHERMAERAAKARAAPQMTYQTVGEPSPVEQGAADV